MKRAVVVLLLMIANAIFGSGSNDKPAAAIPRAQTAGRFYETPGVVGSQGTAFNTNARRPSGALKGCALL